MRLLTSTIIAQVQKVGSEPKVNVPAGKSVKIETTPGGVEILNVVVPAGKRWEVSFGVDVREFDV